MTLSDQQQRQFDEQGYLVVADVLGEADLVPVVGEYEALLDRLCGDWHHAGTLSATYADLPFGERLCRVITEVGPIYADYFDITLSFDRAKGMPIHLGPAIFDLLRNPRLLDVVEDFIGPEILSNPIQHVRIKPPLHLVPEHHNSSLLVGTEWHQDHGVTLPEADETNMLTVWIPVVDATPENGCLQVIPGSHREGLQTHCYGPLTRTGFGIPDKFMRPADAIPVPVQRGGVLFLHRQTMHGSLENVSDGIRWSFDLRYNPIGQPTGRPAFPGFVARSRANPASATTHAEWFALWQSARERFAADRDVAFYRWAKDNPACA